jgi:hypothetical protein
MSLVPYNFYPEYSVEEVVDTELPKQQRNHPLFLYDSNHFKI